MGIRNREAYFNVNSDDDGNVHDPRKEVQFYLDMLFVEREIMDLYKKKFNIDPLTENGRSYYTEQQQVERHAQNIAFWQKLLNEYKNVDSATCTSNPRYFYIKMKESEVRINVFRKFDHNKSLLKKIITRLVELVNER